MKFSQEIIRFRYCIYAIIVLLIYGQSIAFGVNLDDFLVLEGLPKLQSIVDDFHEVFQLRYSSNEYRPVTIASFVLERRIFGSLTPSISHGINLVIYFFIAILGDRLLRTLSKNQYLLVITATIALFLVHPLHVEVVASIKSRDGLLSMFFGLIATTIFVKYFAEKKSFISLIIGCVFFLLALLSKIDAIGFALFILFLFLFNSSRKTKLRLAGFAIFTFLLFNFIMNVKTSLVNTSGLPESYVSFSENPMVDLPNTVISHVTSGAQTMCLYFQKLILPIKLQFYYGFDVVSVYNSNQFQAWIFIIINILILVFATYYRKKNFLLFLSIFSIYIFLLFASNLFNYVAGIIADRYAFLASIWFCFAVVFIIHLMIKSSKVKLALFTVAFLSYSILSFQRTKAWKNFDTLITADANKIEHSYEGLRIASSHYYNLAIEPNNSESDWQFDKALGFAKKANQVYFENSVMHKQTALIYFRKGDINAAVNNIENALSVSPNDPQIITIAGDLYTTKKEYSTAIEVYKLGLENAPKNSYFIYQISNSYFLNNQLEDCEQFNQSVIESDSTLFEPWENLGYLYLHLKDTTKANEYFNKAKELGLILDK